MDSTRDSEMKVELGLSSGHIKMPAGNSPLKSLFLAAIPCGVGTAQGMAKCLRVVPCEKNPQFLQKIKPLNENRWCDECVCFDFLYVLVQFLMAYGKRGWVHKACKATQGHLDLHCRKSCGTGNKKPCPLHN